MRHAQAEPYADSDFARELTARGREQAEATGRWLAAQGLLADYALVSAAARTRATWALVQSATGARAHEEITDAVYNAPTESVLELLRLVPDAHRTVLYLGHNPATAQLAAVLSDAMGGLEVMQQLLTGFPTAAVAVFELPGGWSELTEGANRLTHFHTPEVG